MSEGLRFLLPAVMGLQALMEFTCCAPCPEDDVVGAGLGVQVFSVSFADVGRAECGDPAAAPPVQLFEIDGVVTQLPDVQEERALGEHLVDIEIAADGRGSFAPSRAAQLLGCVDEFGLNVVTAHCVAFDYSGETVVLRAEHGEGGLSVAVLTEQGALPKRGVDWRMLPFLEECVAAGGNERACAGSTLMTPEVCLATVNEVSACVNNDVAFMTVSLTCMSEADCVDGQLVGCDALICPLAS